MDSLENRSKMAKKRLIFEQNRGKTSNFAACGVDFCLRRKPQADAATLVSIKRPRGGILPKLPWYGPMNRKELR